jgi:hypothetical protein
MSQQQLSSPEGTHEGETPGERVTLSIPIHLAIPTRATVVREGPKPARPTGRIARVARILAQAHHFQNLLDTGVVRTQMELAELTKLTTARITQIMNLLVLAPDIQEELLFLPPVTERSAPINERDLRPLVRTLVWSEQRERWARLRAQTDEAAVASRDDDVTRAS